MQQKTKQLLPTNNQHLTNDSSDLSTITISTFPAFTKSSNPDDYFFYKNFQILKTGQVKNILGKGAFGEVNLVKNKKDNRLFAMKIIDKKKLKEIKLIKDEISVHICLDHMNIIKLYSFSETKDFFYLVMEYAEKGSLYTEIKRSKGIKEDKARDYFIQVIHAINYIHDLGIVHRDIKPENLLLNNKNQVKLCDFGGVIKIEDGEERQTFFGTYEYMAPEIIDGTKYNNSVDIWALGILLYEMLHGYSPFRVTERKENMKEYYQIYENIVLTEELYIKEDLSEEVCHLIKSKYD